MKIGVGWITTHHDEKTGAGGAAVVADNDEEISADGRFVPKDRYPVLYKVMKDVWGDSVVERGDEFAVPDLRGKIG